MKSLLIRYRKDDMIYIDTIQGLKIKFSGGVVWTEETIKSKVIAPKGTNQDDYIFLTDDIHCPDKVYGLGGNDYLYGRNSNAIDKLYGGSGDDHLYGGKGNDFLYGENGSDTYRFLKGDGIDFIEDHGEASEIDSILFPNTLSRDPLSLEKHGDSLLIRYSPQDTIWINHHFRVGYSIEQIKFSDNTIWNKADIEAHLKIPEAPFSTFDALELGIIYS